MGKNKEAIYIYEEIYTFSPEYTRQMLIDNF